MQSTQLTFDIMSNEDSTIGSKLVSFHRLLQNAVDELDEGIKLVWRALFPGLTTKPSDPLS